MGEINGIKGKKFENWAGTFSCSPQLYFTPNNEQEIKSILALARDNQKKVRVVGKGHSPSDLACTSDYMISLEKMNHVLDVNEKDFTIKVEAGMVIEDLNHIYLPKYNMALSILGSISEIAVGGMISTATHGTGYKHHVFAHYVTELEFITAEGETIVCSRETNKDIFLAALCSLGAIGIISAVTLRCESTYYLSNSQNSSKLDEVLENLDALVEGCDHFRFNWFPHSDNVVISQVNKTTERPVSKSLVEDWLNWFKNYAIGYYLLEFCYWISTFIPILVPVINLIFFYLIYYFKSYTVDISHKIFNFDCLFKQYVTEWAIPRSKVSQALKALRASVTCQNGILAHFPVEVRFVAEDDVYLSPAYGRETCYINIIMYRPYGKFVKYQPYWKLYEDIMKSLEGRPHWAKEHSLKYNDLKELYPKFEDWCKIREKLDPTGMFINPYIQRILS